MLFHQHEFRDARLCSGAQIGEVDAARQIASVESDRMCSRADRFVDESFYKSALNIEQVKRNGLSFVN